MKVLRLWFILAAVAVLLAGARESSAQATEANLEQRVSAIERQLEALRIRVDELVGSSGEAAERAPTLVEQIDALDQKIRVAERQRELAASSAAAAAESTPTVGAGRDGFFLRSSDSAFRLNLRGYVQVDGRFLSDDTGRPGADTFALRRVRPIIEGVLFHNFGFRIMPDYGNGTTSILDAHFDATMQPSLRLRAGKFKGPVSLERLVSGSELLFVERAYTANLLPNRDTGVQVWGELWGGVLTYAGGIFNGAVDGGSVDLDADDNKEIEGRLFAHPFRKITSSPLQGLGVGVAGTHGRKEGTTAAPSVPSYRTSGQQVFFRYLSDGTAAGTVLADGLQYRISPQAYFYYGPLGLLTDYALSSQNVRRGSSTGRLGNRAWQVAVSWVVTGQASSYRSVTPARPIDPSQGHWGALEIAARYTKLAVDKEAFPLFANPQTSARVAQAWTLGLNWHLNRNAKFTLNYEQTDFKESEGGRPKADEKAFLQRFQVSF